MPNLRRLRHYLWVLSLALLLGCGGGGADSVGSGVSGVNPPGISPTVSGQTATVIIRHQLLARAVPSGISNLRVTGFNSDNRTVFGPRTVAKASEIHLQEVPIETVSLRIEYLQGETVRGRGVVSVSLEPSEILVINDPPFEDVGPPVSPTGQVILEFPQLAQLPESIDGIRITGVTAMGRAVFGPISDLLKAELTLDGVPVEVISLTVEYLQGETVKGLGRVQVVVEGEATVRVEAPVYQPPAAILESLQLSPGDLTVGKGQSLDLTLMGIFDDHTQQELTASATWQVESVTVARVEDGRLYGLSAGTAILTASIGEISVSRQVTVTPAQLLSLAISPLSPSVPAGLTQQLSVMGTFSDNTSIPIHDLEWDSSEPYYASVDENGLVTAHAEGSVTITAVKKGVTAQVALTILPGKLQQIIINAPASIPLGLTRKAEAYGVFSDGQSRQITSDVVWTTLSEETAVVTNGQFGGEVTARKLGDFTLSATLDGVEAKQQVTVGEAVLSSITVLPQSATLAKGLSIQLSAWGTFSDGTYQPLTGVTWVSGMALSINSSGLARAVGLGQVEVNAYLAGRRGTASVIITPAVLQEILIEPQTVRVPLGVSKVLDLTLKMSDGLYSTAPGDVTWASSNSEVAVVDHTTNPPVVRTLAVGSATLTATRGDISAAVPVEVTEETINSISIEPTVLELPTQSFQLFKAYANYSNGQRQDVTLDVAWATSDLNVARFSTTEKGKLETRFVAGPTSLTVTAALPGGGPTAQQTLIVRPAKLLSISVTPLSSSIPVGGRSGLRVYGRYDNNSSDTIEYACTYTSSAPSVGTVGGHNGRDSRFEGRRVGTFTITVVPFGDLELAQTVSVTVTPAVLKAVELSPGYNRTPPVGASYQLYLHEVYSDERKLDITTDSVWASDDPTIATVENGLVHILRSGRTDIRAVHRTGTLNLSVSSASVTQTGLRVDPKVSTIPVGIRYPMKATGLYNSSAQWDLTKSVVWESSAPDIVSVSNTAETSGELTALQSGVATITARTQGGGFQASATVTVNQASLVNLAIDQGPSVLEKTHQRRFLVQGIFSDGSRYFMGDRVAWSLGSTGLGEVSNEPADSGTLRLGTTLGEMTLSVTDLVSSLSTSQHVSVVDEPVLAVKRVDKTLVSLSSSPDDRRLYFVHPIGLNIYSLPELELLDTVITEATGRSDLSPDGSTFWIAHPSQPYLTRVNTTNLNVDQIPLPGFSGASQVAFGGDGRAFVRSGSNLLVLNGTTGTVMGTLAHGSITGLMAVDRTSPNVLFRTSTSPTRVSRFEIVGDRPVFRSTSTTGSGGGNLRINPRGSGFFVPSGGGNDVPNLGIPYALHYFDLFDLSHVFSTVRVEEAYPRDAAFSPDGLLGYSVSGTSMVNADHPQASVVDLATGQVLGYVPLDYTFYSTGPDRVEVTQKGNYFISYSNVNGSDPDGSQLSVIRLR